MEEMVAPFLPFRIFISYLRSRKECLTINNKTMMKRLQIQTLK